MHDTRKRKPSAHDWPVLVFVDDRDMLRNHMTFVQPSLDDFVDHQSLQLRTTAFHQFPDTGGREFRHVVFLIAEAGQGGQDIRFRWPTVQLQEDIEIFNILAFLRDHFDVFHLC